MEGMDGHISQTYPRAAAGPGGEMLVRCFLDYASEAVPYAAAGTPPVAMTYQAFGYFAEDCDLFAAFTDAQQTELIDQLRPPPGRYVTWDDFLGILQIIADHRFPNCNESDGLGLVVAGVIDHFHRQAQAALTARRDSLSSSLPAKHKHKDIVPDTLPEWENEATAVIRGWCAAAMHHHASASPEAPSASTLDHITDVVCRRFVDKLQECAPRPCIVKARRINFAEHQTTAQKLVSVWRTWIHAIVASYVTSQSSAALGNVSIRQPPHVWQTISASGAILFPTSPAIAQEELSFQVCIHALQR